MIIPATTGSISISLLNGYSSVTGSNSISTAGSLFQRNFDITGQNSLKLSSFMGASNIGDPDIYPDNKIYYMSQLANASWDATAKKWQYNGTDMIEAMYQSGSNALKVAFYMSYFKYRRIDAAIDYTAQDFQNKLNAIVNHQRKLPVLIRFVLCFERLGMTGGQVYGRDYYNPNGDLNYYDYSELDEWGARPENYNGRVPFTLADTTIVDTVVNTAFKPFVEKAYEILGTQLKWVSTGLSSADEFGSDLETKVYDVSPSDTGLISNYFTTFAYHPANILKFRNFLKAKYGSDTTGLNALNTAWTSSYTSFDQIPLPKAKYVTNYNDGRGVASGSWATVYNDTPGKDFFLYRHNNLGEFSLKIKNVIKTISPKIKYMIEIGNSTGKNAVLQGTIGAPYFTQFGADVLKSFSIYSYQSGSSTLGSSPSWGYITSIPSSYDVSLKFGNESAQFDPYVSNNGPLVQSLITQNHSASLARGQTICLLLGDPDPGEGNKYLDYWKYLLAAMNNLKNTFGDTPKPVYRYSPTVNYSLSEILSGTNLDNDFLRQKWNEQNRTLGLTDEAGLGTLLDVAPVSSSQVYNAFSYLRVVPTISGGVSAICSNGGVNITISLSSINNFPNSTRYEYLYYIGKDPAPTDPKLFTRGFNGRATVTETYSAPASAETWYAKIIHRTYGTIYWSGTVTVPACASFPTVTTGYTCINDSSANMTVTATGGSGIYSYASYIAAGDCGNDPSTCAATLLTYLNGTAGWRSSMTGTSKTFGPNGNTTYYMGIRDNAGNSGINTVTINCTGQGGGGGGTSGISVSLGQSCNSQVDGTGIISVYVSNSQPAYAFQYCYNSANHGGYTSTKTTNTDFTFPPVYDDDYNIFVRVFATSTDTTPIEDVNWNGNPLTVACVPRQAIITSVTTGCNGVGSGVATLTINKKYGVGPFEYSIDAGQSWQTGNTFYNLANNININGNAIQIKDIGFSNTITTYNGVASTPNCSVSTSITLTVEFGTCGTNGGYSTGQAIANLSASGGNGPYTYYYKDSTSSNWITLSGTTVTTFSNANYDFKVTDTNGGIGTKTGLNNGCAPYQWPPSILYMTCQSSPTRVTYNTQIGTPGTTITGYEYSTNNISWTNATNPTTIGTGTYYFRVKASDNLYSPSLQYTVSC